METTDKPNISIQTTVNAPVSVVWKHWITPEDIVEWNNASDDWHTTRALNDLWVGGKFLSRMEAKDGSFGFDFEGTYINIILHETITYTLADDRKVTITFTPKGNQTLIDESFEAETTNSLERQRLGWQAILNNFKRYCEGKEKG